MRCVKRVEVFVEGDNVFFDCSAADSQFFAYHAGRESLCEQGEHDLPSLPSFERVFPAQLDLRVVGVAVLAIDDNRIEIVVPAKIASRVNGFGFRFVSCGSAVH